MVRALGVDVLVPVAKDPAGEFALRAVLGRPGVPAGASIPRPWAQSATGAKRLRGGLDTGPASRRGPAR